MDVGARYGMHPSWRGYKGKMSYLMFEPDTVEAERLRSKLDKTVFEIFETALDSSEGERTFHLLKHRGLSSFLKPDLTSECFRRLKPGQAEIEREIKIRTRTIDAVMAERNINVDFLKVDTEGTEHDVIEGAAAQLEDCILGVRSSCNFQPCFIGQKLFSETHDFLLSKDFVLLNLDYRGYGYPRLGLFRKPDPIEPEDFRYGVLVAADGVWIRRPEWCARRFGSDADTHDLAMLKLALFCMLNNAPDVGIDMLREHVLESGLHRMSERVRGTRLFSGLQLDIANFLGRWRTVPDEQWDRVRGIFAAIYGEPLEGGSEFYPQVQEMEARLREAGQ
ncbi:MAG: FkbM family methyltransferase [Sulfuritalea sp.]|nr:FkbM family methyltransferase [Sulfuritalea sp.]